MWRMECPSLRNAEIWPTSYGPKRERDLDFILEPLSVGMRVRCKHEVYTCARLLSECARVSVCNSADP